MFYRYGPRTVGDNGGPPVIHHSVAEKIAFGIERYAPVTLPDTANVLMPDGTMEQIKGYNSKVACHTSTEQNAPANGVGGERRSRS